MELIFDDNGLHLSLAPLTLTKPVAELRFGILTIRESWEGFFNAFKGSFDSTFKTEEYLYSKFSPAKMDRECLIIAGNIKPSETLAKVVWELKEGEALFANNAKIAQKGTTFETRIDFNAQNELLFIEKPWHLFQKNEAAIQLDFNFLTKNRISQALSNTNSVSNPENIFLEEGAIVEHAILNAATGPIYIGKNAEIMEGSMIRGPFGLCEDSTVKMGAKIYGATSVGPHCKVGGEISNSLFQAYSNKGHDGFMGNSVIGEWCNFGADTNTSNLKNNYTNVRIYSYETRQLEESDVLFCGTIMGDHSKTGINTMLNTATSVGVSANVFGAGFPPKFIPSFSWGEAEENKRFILEKAFEVAASMMIRRKIPFTEGDKSILTHLYNKMA